MSNYPESVSAAMIEEANDYRLLKSLEVEEVAKANNAYAALAPEDRRSAYRIYTLCAELAQALDETTIRNVESKFHMLTLSLLKGEVNDALRVFEGYGEDEPEWVRDARKEFANA